jgi:hypothetical protein
MMKLPAGATTIIGQLVHSRKLSFGCSPRSCADVSGAAQRDGNEAVTAPAHGSAGGVANMTGGTTAAVRCNSASRARASDPYGVAPN